MYVVYKQQGMPKWWTEFLWNRVYFSAAAAGIAISCFDTAAESEVEKTFVAGTNEVDSEPSASVASDPHAVELHGDTFWREH